MTKRRRDYLDQACGILWHEVAGELWRAAAFGRASQHGGRWRVAHGWLVALRVRCLGVFGMCDLIAQF